MMRDSIARSILFALGIVGIGAGLLGLFGLTTVERTSAFLVGVAGISGGIAMVRRSRGPNPPIGG
jgi:hypothetical protein